MIHCDLSITEGNNVLSVQNLQFRPIYILQSQTILRYTDMVYEGEAFDLQSEVKRVLGR